MGASKTWLTHGDVQSRFRTRWGVLSILVAPGAVVSVLARQPGDGFDADSDMDVFLGEPDRHVAGHAVVYQHRQAIVGIGRCARIDFSAVLDFTGSLGDRAARISIAVAMVEKRATGALNRQAMRRSFRQ